MSDLEAVGLSEERLTHSCYLGGVERSHSQDQDHECCEYDD